MEDGGRELSYSLASKKDVDVFPHAKLTNFIKQLFSVKNLAIDINNGNTSISSVRQQ